LLVLQLIEDCCREDLQPIEWARAFKAFMDRNVWSVRRLADEVSVAHLSVMHALALLDLPESVQERIGRGDLPLAMAYEVSEVPGVTPRLGKNCTLSCDVRAEVIC
jgi:ParB family transcriptional regulator, chromosome partitioning protein